ncbi:HDOD domain-containing protein [Denitratisoma oestradiolicum]|uniref:Putative signal transduction protein n=1 Tax=Denitratisoma oestradiolicum TaxID=311182 RepID=A0A6S6Y696_9PROT|nr:HDOD domain-containing protein [Denitratisoma oestradiolicum]TWO79403.1 histidine kinase [Denitratisoma oestradiolicum]CAB1368108.1 putative signal transduction protein [Denitratisoma oestradiolicum]
MSEGIGISTSAVDSHRVGALLESSIRDIDIPPRPAILERIVTEMHRDEPDFMHLSIIISADVSLAAGLIKTANSPYFGIRRKVRSIKEALMVLGLRAASHAIAGLVLRQIFPPTPTMERFWDSSARIARLSGWLAQHNPGGVWVQPEDAYTFGLFRDCGIPVLLKRIHHYPEILDDANRDAILAFTAVEEAALPTNHAIVGCLLAQSWWLPEELCLAIRHHHNGTALEENGSEIPVISQGLIAHAQLAEYLVQHHTGRSLTREWDKLGDACLRLLNLTEENLERLREESAEVATAED